MAYPSLDKQYYLFTDNSKTSLSGIVIQYYEEVKEDGTIVNVPHPITFQSGTFHGSQKNGSALANEAYVIYMSFHKIVFYLKDAHLKIRYNHAPLCKFIYSAMKNDNVINWLLEIHAITPYIEFEHIKGRDNILLGILTRLKTLSLYEANDPNEPGSEYDKSMFASYPKIICDVDISKHSNKEFEIKDIKYHIDEKDLNSFPSLSTDPNPSSFKCNLDMKNV